MITGSCKMLLRQVFDFSCNLATDSFLFFASSDLMQVVEILCGLEFSSAWDFVMTVIKCKYQICHLIGGFDIPSYLVHVQCIIDLQSKLGHIPFGWLDTPLWLTRHTPFGWLTIARNHCTFKPQLKSSQMCIQLEWLLKKTLLKCNWHD